VRILNLSQTQSIALDSNGDGTAQLGPSAPGVVWTVALVSVSVATNTNEAECKVYIGPSASAATFVDGTLSGSTGDSTDRATMPIYPGMYLFAVWTGGDAGQLATVNVMGTQQVP
jgi:hypothetical protein